MRAEFVAGSLQGKRELGGCCHESRLRLSQVLQKHKVMKAWDTPNWFLIKIIHCFLCCLKLICTILHVQFLPDRKYCFFATSTNRFMHCKEISPVYYVILKPCTACGENACIFNVKAGGTYSALESRFFCLQML
jgi:hypothetical protein